MRFSKAVVTVVGLGIFAVLAVGSNIDPNQISPESTTFTCDIGTACAEYFSPDAETANGLKIDCDSPVDGEQCCNGNSYMYCCEHENTETGVTSKTYSDSEGNCSGTGGTSCTGC